MSYNEANVSEEVIGSGKPFNYLDGLTKTLEAKEDGNTEPEAMGDAGDGPTQEPTAPALSPTPETLYRGPERGFQAPRGDVRHDHRGFRDRCLFSNRAARSQPEIRAPASSVDASLDHKADNEDFAGFRCRYFPKTQYLSGIGLDHSSERFELSNDSKTDSIAKKNQAETSFVQRVSSDSRSHCADLRNMERNLQRRPNKKTERLRKKEGGKEETENLSNILKSVYQRNSHRNADDVILALKAEQATPAMISWKRGRREIAEMSAGFRKVAPPKNSSLSKDGVNLYNNNNKVDHDEEERGKRGEPGGRVSCNDVMEELRQQPMVLREKEELRSAVLTSASRRSGPATFDRRRHVDEMRRQMMARRRREPGGVRSFFAALQKEFGHPITSYFDFLLWLILLNLCIAVIVALFLVVPRYLPWPSVIIGDNGAGNAKANLTSRLKGDIPIGVARRLAVPAETQSGSGGGNSSEIDGSNVDGETTTTTTTPSRSCPASSTLESSVAAFISGSRFMTSDVPLFFGFFDNYVELSVRITSYIRMEYITGIAYVVSLTACLYLAVFLVIFKMLPYLQESLAHKLDRVDRGFSLMLFTTFDFGASDETTVILNQIVLTDELLSKLDAVDETIGRRRRRVRRCCDVVLRCIVAILLSAVFLLCVWLVKLAVDVRPATEVSAGQWCAWSLLLDYLAPLTLFAVVKLFSLFSTAMSNVENWKPATKQKINQARIVTTMIALTLCYMYWLRAGGPDVDCERDRCYFVRESSGVGVCRVDPRDSASRGGCGCWPVTIGQHFYRLSTIDFAWTFLSVVLVQFPRKFLFSQLCLHRSCGRFSIQPFSITRRMTDLIFAQMICLLGLFYAPGLSLLTSVKFLVFFYLMRLTVHCNCIPKGRLFQSTDGVVFSYSLLLAGAVLATFPFHLVVMQGFPAPCGPYRGMERFSQLFRMDVLRHYLPSRMGNALVIFLDSPLTPLLLFVFITSIIIFVICGVVNGVEKRKLYQMQNECHIERRDRSFLLRRLAASRPAPEQQQQQTPPPEPQQ